MTFEDVLEADPGLKCVGFYFLKCSQHGTFRMLANDVVPECCPRCGEPAHLAGSRVRCATARPVPLINRWKSDNADVSPHTAPPWLRRWDDFQEC